MVINRKIQTLDEFTIQQMGLPHATGELSDCCATWAGSQRVHVK